VSKSTSWGPSVSVAGGSGVLSHAGAVLVLRTAADVAQVRAHPKEFGPVAADPCFG
jgi:hypothetical protein